MIRGCKRGTAADGEIATPIRAELIGDDQATALGIEAARSAAPVIALCRVLIAAGIDPASPMHVYRGATLALRVRSVGEAADLVVNSKGTGFVRRASRIAQRAPAVTSPKPNAGHAARPPRTDQPIFKEDESRTLGRAVPPARRR